MDLRSLPIISFALEGPQKSLLKVKKGTILSHFSRPKMTLKTIVKVNKLDAVTPSCTQPAKPFSIVSMQYSQH